MARPSKEELQLKLQAISVAIESLVEESTPSKNLLTYNNVCSLANSSIYADKFKTKISISSLKQPTSKDFKKIKELINSKKNEYQSIKKLTLNKTKTKIDNLEKKVDSLTYIVTELLDNELKLKKILLEKDASINLIKKERDKYQGKLEMKEDI